MVVLNTAVKGIEPAQIADLGTLDKIQQPTCRRPCSRAVGYGTEVRKPESGPQKPQPMTTR